MIVNNFLRFLISIHAPLTGSDASEPNGVGTSNISIHAPLTGSDTIGCTLCQHFFIFQSTLPSQGATCASRICKNISCDFNPRSPHRERLPLLLLLDMFQLFQSTLPSQGATVDSLGNVFSEIISIHALLTGSDPIRYPVGTNQGNFNPRSPHRERPSCGNRWGAGANFNPRSPHRERPIYRRV